MKIFINTIKTTSLSLLTITSITSAVMLTSTTAQAGPWIGMNANVCAPYNNSYKDVTRYEGGIYPTLINGNPYITCPLKLEEPPGGSPKTVRVWINYSRHIHGSSIFTATPKMDCKLYSADYFGNTTTTPFVMQTGSHKSSVKNINSPYGGTITVRCDLKRSILTTVPLLGSFGGIDILYSFNYKIL